MKNKIAIIHNLPSGGGLRMLSEIIFRYRNICDIDILSISSIKPNEIANTNTFWYKVKPWNGFLLYNFWVNIILPSIHKNISKKIKWEKYDSVFVTHDYFSKSPNILKYIKSKKIIYLCQEAQREFYESSEFHAPFFKDKIANIFRFPIKINDENNVKYATKIVCNSKYSKSNLEKIYKKTCEIVYPGVNKKVFFPKKVKREDIILCIGGLNKVKDQEYVVNTLRPILNRYKLILVGNGRDRDVLKLKNVIGEANVKIIKSIKDSDLSQLYRKAKVTCIGAHGEPFGLSSLESQACGTPVVSVDEGGPKETIINGVTGYLAKRRGNDYLNKVIKTIDNCNDMGEKCIENINKKWTWERTLKPLDKYFLK